MTSPCSASPVVLCLDRAGLVGEDGPTHHGVFDLAYFRPIPNLTISSPMDEHELRRLMYTAQLPDQGPFVIRYPRGRGVLLDWKCPLEEIPRRQRAQTERRQRPGSHHPRSHRQRGRTCHRACGEGQRNLHSPLRPAFSQAARRSPAARGGTQLPACRHHRRRCQKKEEWAVPYLEFMADNDYIPHFRRIGVPDAFIEHGTIQELHHLCGMDEEGIYNQLIIDS